MSQRPKVTDEPLTRVTPSMVGRASRRFCTAVRGLHIITAEDSGICQCCNEEPRECRREPVVCMREATKDWGESGFAPHRRYVA